MGKPAETDRRPLQSLSHSFTLDWVVTCRSAAEARAAIAVALRILSELGVQLNPQKTRAVHVRHGFEFLGYLIRRGRQLRLPTSKIVTGARVDSLKITLSGDRCLIKNHTSCSRRQRTTGGKDEAKDESEFT